MDLQDGSKERWNYFPDLLQARFDVRDIRKLYVVMDKATYNVFVRK